MPTARLTRSTTAARGPRRILAGDAELGSAGTGRRKEGEGAPFVPCPALRVNQNPPGARSVPARPQGAAPQSLDRHCAVGPSDRGAAKDTPGRIFFPLKFRQTGPASLSHVKQDV